MFLEWEFVQNLAYKEQTPEDAEFVKLIYTIRLRKVCLVYRYSASFYCFSRFE